MKHLLLIIFSVSVLMLVSCGGDGYMADIREVALPVKFEDSLLTISSNLDSATFRAELPWTSVSEIYVKQGDKQSCIFPVEPRDTAYRTRMQARTPYQVDWLTIKPLPNRNEIRIVVEPNPGKTRMICVMLWFFNSRTPCYIVQKGKAD